MNTSLSYCDSVLFLNGSLPGSLKTINIGLCDISVLCAGTKKYPAVHLKKNPTVLSQGGRIESGLVLILRYAGDDDDIRNSCAMLGWEIRTIS